MENLLYLLATHSCKPNAKNKIWVVVLRLILFKWKIPDIDHMSTAESQTEAPQLNAQCSRCNNRILLCKIRSKKNISLSADSHTSKCYCLLIHDALRIKRVYLQTSLLNTDRSFHSFYIVESYAESYGTLKLWKWGLLWWLILFLCWHSKGVC